MTCKCARNGGKFRSWKHGSTCKMCTETRVWWNRGESCWVFRCRNVTKMLTDPPEWAFGNTRRATVGDSPAGDIIENADYIAVRSCFCRCGRCKHYTEGQDAD